jgi:hypothetical protein
MDHHVGARAGRLEGSDIRTRDLYPLLLAVLFALLSLPLVAMSLDAAEYGPASGYGVHPVAIPGDDLGRWSAAFGAVLAASLVGGAIGARWVRAHAILGALSTTLIAWIAGIAALPVMPALLHQNRAGYMGFVEICLDSCGSAIHTDDALNGVRELYLFWLGPLAAPVPFVALVVGVVCWTFAVRRWSRR